MVSIVIPVHNCLEFTKQCVDSIRANTRDYEIIIVDNGSTDNTLEWLIKQCKEFTDIVYCNFLDNKGFAIATNTGADIALGDWICCLNNDVVVPHNWLLRLLRHTTVGKGYYDIIGPCSNFVSAKQLVRIPIYKDLDELNEQADKFFILNEGLSTDVNWIIGFCLLVSQKNYHQLGGLDERFGIGNSEDIDFCIKAKQAGLKIGIAKDTYIHHYGSATFKNLSKGTSYLCHRMCFENSKKLSRKWGDINYDQTENYSTQDNNDTQNSDTVHNV